MPRSLAQFSGPEASNHTPSLADFITITFGFRFSVHTGANFAAYPSKLYPGCADLSRCANASAGDGIPGL
jgi:hypothetical protein